MCTARLYVSKRLQSHDSTCRLPFRLQEDPRSRTKLHRRDFFGPKSTNGLLCVHDDDKVKIYLRSKHDGQAGYVHVYRQTMVKNETYFVCVYIYIL